MAKMRAFDPTTTDEAIVLVMAAQRRGLGLAESEAAAELAESVARAGSERALPPNKQEIFDRSVRAQTLLGALAPGIPLSVTKRSCWIPRGRRFAVSLMHRAWNWMRRCCTRYQAQ
jgi:hypothetical protein